MLFNSGVFLRFFLAFLLLYWLFRNSLRSRNLLILAASYVFYGWWDYRFLALLLFSSLLDFGVGLALDRTRQPAQRKLLLAASLAGNLGVLGAFKYYGFFVSSLTALLEGFGMRLDWRSLDVVLPVGISFYTFQTLSYTIDIYRGELRPTRNLVNFLAFVSFFPQLVAGPIERARHLLPQFETVRLISLPMLQEGVWLCLWGMFKKVVLADNLAPLVELVYNQPLHSGPLVILGTVAFAFQIYCDFSGYSDLARGTARLLGFDIMVNFDIPYAASNLRQFWRRWHISLSTWLRDYLYISLGGNRRGAGRTYLNLLVTMILGGLWHGAAWNFVLWGVWHGIGLAAHRLLAMRTSGAAISKRPASAAVRLPKLCSWLGTMLFVLYGWLLFRSGSFHQIAALTSDLATWRAPSWTPSFIIRLVIFAAPLITMELWQEQSQNRLVALTLPAWARYGLQGLVLLAILIFWERENVPFIYFQF